ncbi:MAG TPA: toll/interleukin-1 receptor domain-containing protein [Bradyrhizobium sp.]|nr:toll/interleukin-1 receptor domain-containing protein [Bradyrhizobium sp.]
MADNEHVTHLRKGAGQWNEWRVRSREFSPNLSSADLSGAQLRGANLSQANLSDSNLRHADLDEADLDEANLRRADLTGAKMTGARLVKANLSRAKLIDAKLMRANLIGAELSEANLRRVCLIESELRNARLVGAKLNHANLEYVKLIETDLCTADLRDANLSGADLSGADMRDANLRGANLRKAELSFANLTEADLSKADLSGAALYETVLANIDLTNVSGLETCWHSGPSVIDFRTLKKSHPLPLKFLRGVGLPDNLIEYLPSLLMQAIQYYSCFISYSSKDDDFATRIHADLQNNGVRCWFAPHDLPIGGKIRDEIDAAIRLRDKVVLILSEHSIRSDWVEDEVEAAYEEEQRRGQTMLFPICLDDAVMETSEAWAAKLRRNRNIGDFRQWNHDRYHENFKRVLRDLTAGDAKKKKG